MYEGLQNEGFASKIDKVRAAIEQDDFRSPEVKKLTGSDYYRARLDDASRLLLSFVEFDGRKACLALEVIAQHAYDKSRFLRGARVDESKIPDLPTDFVPDARPIRYLHTTRATFHHLDKPLSFDDAQEEVLRHPLPLVLVGSAGSGKTALIVQRLRQEAGRVAYITESAWLAQLARGLYVACGFDPGEQEADFLSYQQLIESVEVPRGRAALFRDFVPLFQRHRHKLRFADAHQCFEEIRGVITADPDGPLSLDAYLALGVRQSIFLPEQRREIYPLFQAWRAYLEQSGLYEPNLLAHSCIARTEPRYDFIAIDEVQDLTNAQLALALRALKPHGRFIIAGDANQIVHPNFFSWSKVKSLFWRGGGFDETRDISILAVSYRNSRSVTRVANDVLRLKHARFGSVDRESTGLMRTSQCPEGEVTCFTTSSEAVAELDAKTRRSTRVAVVVLRDEHKAEARARFRTPLVFSVIETKGLEYDNVILFRLVSCERNTFAELCDGVSATDLELDELVYRRAKDKADRSLEIYKFFVNALYVALTRAMANVYLVEDDPSHPLLQLLGIHQEGSAARVQTQTASIEEWQREAHRLEQHGKQEQVEAIRSQVLQQAPVPWKVLEGDTLRQLRKAALDPARVSSKLRQQLLDFALFHREDILVERLGAARYRDLQQFARLEAAVRRRMLEGYDKKNFKPVLEKCDRHGVDFRNPHNLTPLMLAALAGNLPLVQALLQRGASPEARDHVGRTALHWALLRAYDDAAFATGDFGSIWDALAVPSFDLQVDGRLMQVGREQGEYFALHACIASYSVPLRTNPPRRVGLGNALLRRGAFDAFPEVVIPERRRRREYWNHLLARNEANRSYVPNRKLWVRGKQGHYWLNPAVSLKVRNADGDEHWLPLPELVGDRWQTSNYYADPEAAYRPDSAGGGDAEASEERL
ncbi:MAG TPA: UvrD-helicase domain-containing protein [Terriglobales bacterium]|nr:UvrD-helicase domain-containing protein [Terriglobales bacterium]